jgi:hypothetical protein
LVLRDIAEWVRWADDALWRRDKPGLRLSKAEAAKMADGVRAMRATDHHVA